jgi:hypothetical protein
MLPNLPLPSFPVPLSFLLLSLMASPGLNSNIKHLLMTTSNIAQGHLQNFTPCTQYLALYHTVYDSLQFTNIMFRTISISRIINKLLTLFCTVLWAMCHALSISTPHHLVGQDPNDDPHGSLAHLMGSTQKREEKKKN